MSSLLDRSDISDLPADGWMVMVATCNAGMIGAESGEFDADEWADLLVRVLDKAEAVCGLTQGDVLWRRMMACAAALNYFGVREGSPARDPEKAFLWLLSELEGSREGFMRKCEDLLLVRLDPSSVEEIYYAAKWRSSVVSALKSLCDIARYMGDSALKSDALEWCAMATKIPALEG
ncbi:hypothetical protein [Kutzneria sp. NPDC052558]|uniref:hypothetical protein n=1 Tax=Kutzneria sp. NPDC052558 TaxID=3364121 RepID=UPI0037CC726F